MLWPVLGLIAALAVGALLWRRRTLPRAFEAAVAVFGPRQAANDSDFGTDDFYEQSAATPSFETDATRELSASVHALAFGMTRFDYAILGPHRDVLAMAEAAVAEATTQREYFPRRPALLPKLLQALNTTDSRREEIVRLILQDAVLAGNVLQRANSAYYRHGDAVIESVDRAVVILGNEGLRAPVATAVMQPVFRLPRGFFDHFAPVTWDVAQRTALAAEAYARLHRVGDAFVAHLLGLLRGLGQLVLFRLALDKYKHYNVLPRAEVFIRLIQDHDLDVTRRVAQHWEMSDAFLAAIDAQRRRIVPRQMTPLARTLYYADLCGKCAVLNRSEKITEEFVFQLLGEQGLDAASIRSVWPVAQRAVV